MANRELKQDQKVVATSNRRHFKYRSIECQNCGQPLDLSDVYCPYCSQLNTTKPISLKDFITEFLGSIISYDSRFRHTINDLLFYPGRITKRYINGQRQRYANPFRFFLSVSIVYFLLNSLIMNLSSNGENSLVSINDDNPDPTEDIKINKPTTKADKKIINIDTDEQKNSTEPFSDYYFTEEQLDTMRFSERNFNRFTMYNVFHNQNKTLTATQALDSLNNKKSRYNMWLYNRTFRTEQIEKNPKEFVLYVINKIPFFLFFLAPVYALFLWLLYYRRQHRYIEHLIFIFHIFTFLFLGMLIAILPDLVIGTEIFQGLLFLVVGPVYLYIAMRNYYGQRFWKTILKFVILNIIFSVITSIAILIFVFGTAAIY